MDYGFTAINGKKFTNTQVNRYNQETAKIKKHKDAGMDTEQLENGRHNLFCAFCCFDCKEQAETMQRIYY